MTKKLLAGLVTVVLIFAFSGMAQALTNNAYLDYGSTQGGTNGNWFYQEYNGSTFTNLTYQTTSSDWSFGGPAWTSQDTRLPEIIKYNNVLNFIIMHPGVPTMNAQPSRHDVALTWQAPEAGAYNISGYAEAVGTDEIGYDGFIFYILKNGTTLYSIDIASNDRNTIHNYSLTDIYFAKGDLISFITYDKGNNKGDYGAYNMNISSVPIPAAAWLFGSGLLGLVGLRRKISG